METPIVTEIHRELEPMGHDTFIDDLRPQCDTCAEPAPYGDERNIWIGYHLSWYHKLGQRVLAFIT